MSLLSKILKTFSAAIIAVTFSYSTAVSAAPVPGAVIEGGELVGLTNINVTGFGLYDVTFNGEYQGNVYSQAFVQAAGIAGFNLATGSGVFQGSLFDLMPQLTRGCGASSILCDWMVVSNAGPSPLLNLCSGLPAYCQATGPVLPLSLAGGTFRNYGGQDDNMDSLSFVFGIPSIDIPSLTFLDWTPSKVSEVPVPAAFFLFAPALLGFLGLRRKSKV